MLCFVAVFVNSLIVNVVVSIVKGGQFVAYCWSIIIVKLKQCCRQRPLLLCHHCYCHKVEFRWESLFQSRGGNYLVIVIAKIQCELLFGSWGRIHLVVVVSVVSFVVI